MKYNIIANCFLLKNRANGHAADKKGRTGAGWSIPARSRAPQGRCRYAISTSGGRNGGELVDAKREETNDQKAREGLAAQK